MSDLAGGNGKAKCPDCGKPLMRRNDFDTATIYHLPQGTTIGTLGIPPVKADSVWHEFCPAIAIEPDKGDPTKFRATCECGWWKETHDSVEAAAGAGNAHRRQSHGPGT